LNAYEDGGKIIGDVMQYEAAPLFPDPEGRPGDPAKAAARLTRWTFDLAANTDTFKQEWIDDLAGEFPRFDERFAGLDYRHGFFAASGDRGHSFDTLAHINPKTNTRATYRLPPATLYRSRSLCRAARMRLSAMAICWRPSTAAPNTAAISRYSTQWRWKRARSSSLN